MKDLFGNDIPDNPPMDAPLPWLLWRVDFPDFPASPAEYWLAQTGEQLVAAYVEFQNEIGAVSQFQVHEVTAAPAATAPPEHRIYFERMTDAEAARVWAETQWRPDAPCYFCGGEE